MSVTLADNSKRKRLEQSSTVNYASDCGDMYEGKVKKSRGDNVERNMVVAPEPLAEAENPTKKPKSGDNNEFLRLALLKIQELEHELALLDEESYDSGHHEYEEDDDTVSSDNDHGQNRQRIGVEAEALGFALCARETLNYLASEGITDENPILTALRNQLIGKCRGIPI